MLQRMFSIMLIALLLICTGVSGIYADEAQWPSQVNVAGFNITGIRGNGSSASGILNVSGIGSQNISLSRSSRGDITGNTSINAKVSGADIQGNFYLSNNGLKGQGTVRTSTKPITDASMSITSGGQINGNGRLSLGRIGINTQFSITSGSMNVTGSSPAQAQVDTPLAAYRFDAVISLDGRQGRIGALASGQIQRTGKLTNQASTQKISNAVVNLSDGRCTVSVGGVSVTFSLF